MTTFNLTTFERLREQGVSQETLNAAAKLINELPELEPLRRMSQGLPEEGKKDPENVVIRFPLPGESPLNEAAANYQESILNTAQPPTIRINPNNMPESGKTDMAVLEWVADLAHEYQHHRNVDIRQEARRDLENAVLSGDRSAQVAAADNYLMALIDDETSGRLVENRIYNRYMNNSEYSGTINGKFGKDTTQLALKTAQENNPQATDQQLIEAARGEMLRFAGGQYLSQYMDMVKRTAPGLSDEDLQQIRENALACYPGNPHWDGIRQRKEMKGHEHLTDRDPIPAHTDPSQCQDRPAMSAQESRILAEAFEHLGKPYNKGKFDAFSDQEKECLAGVAMQIGMRHVGDPKVTSDYLSSVFLSDNGKMYVSAGKFDVLQGTTEIAEAKQTLLTQSLEVSHGEHQQLLEQQRLQELNRGGSDGPTMIR